jgi:WS/DGAT/MGAT family acyltransferase
MHIGGVAVFEGPVPDHREFTDHVEQRLALAPRFRQKLAECPFGLARPWWVDDATFDIGYHVRRCAVPHPGEDRQLQTLVGRIFSQRLDRRRPLWEMYLVEGLRSERFALVLKVHHALVDGISGVDLAAFILDAAPDPAPTPPAPVVVRGPEPSRAELLARGVASALEGPLAVANHAAGALMYHPRRLTRSLGTVARAAGTLGWELANPAPRVPLNGSIGPHRRFETRHLSLGELRWVGKQYGAKVNDVVLATVTGALRTWLLSRGVRPEGLELRALVPVNLRADDERGTFGNRVALLRAPLPVYAEDPEQRLLLVRDAMAEIKRSHQLSAAATVIGLSAYAPPPVLGELSRLNFSTRLFNLIVTNVPGPPMPLYLLGRRLESVAPVAFLPSGHGLAVGVFSYNGTISFGLLGDDERLRDLDVIAEGLQTSLSEIRPHARAAERELARAREREPVLD